MRHFIKFRKNFFVALLCMAMVVLGGSNIYAQGTFGPDGDLEPVGNFAVIKVGNLQGSLHVESDTANLADWLKTDAIVFQTSDEVFYRFVGGNVTPWVEVPTGGGGTLQEVMTAGSIAGVNSEIIISNGGSSAADFSLTSGDQMNIDARGNLTVIGTNETTNTDDAVLFMNGSNAYLETNDNDGGSGRIRWFNTVSDDQNDNYFNFYQDQSISSSGAYRNPLQRNLPPSTNPWQNKPSFLTDAIIDGTFPTAGDVREYSRDWLGDRRADIDGGTVSEDGYVVSYDHSAFSGAGGFVLSPGSTFAGNDGEALFSNGAGGAAGNPAVQIAGGGSAPNPGTLSNTTQSENVAFNLTADRLLVSQPVGNDAVYQLDGTFVDDFGGTSFVSEKFAVSSTKIYATAGGFGVDVYDLNLNSTGFLNTTSEFAITVDEASDRVYVSNAGNVDVYVASTDAAVAGEDISGACTFCGQVAIVGTKLYVLDAGTTGVVVYDISTPTSPTALPGENFSVAGGSGGLTGSIQAFDGKMYVANSNEITVFDIATGTQIGAETIASTNNNFISIDGGVLATGNEDNTVSFFSLSQPSVQISGLNYPNADGTNGQVITTDGAGNLSFQNAAGGSPSQGAATSINSADGSGGWNATNILSNGFNFTRDVDTGSLTLGGGSTGSNANGGIIRLDGVGFASNGDILIQSANDPGGDVAINSPGADVSISATDDVSIQGLRYPSADGTNGQVITTDGAGGLSFQNAGGGVTIGAATRVPFVNGAGTDLDYAATLTFNDGTNTLFATNFTATGGNDMTMDGGTISTSSGDVDINAGSGQSDINNLRVNDTGSNVALGNNAGGLLTLGLGTSGIISQDVHEFTDDVVFGNDLVTISGGVVSSTDGVVVRVNTEGSAATDDLNSITQEDDGQLMILRANTNGQTVVVKDGVGNIELANNEDVVLDDVRKTVTLVYVQVLSDWIEVSRSNPGASVEGAEYTPTYTPVFNASGATHISAYYQRVGDVVMGQARFFVNATTAATFGVRISLPVASDIIDNPDVIGLVHANPNLVSADVLGIGATDDLQFNAVPVASGSSEYTISFSYPVQ